MPRSHGCERAAMLPTVTGATMPILTNPLAARLAKKILPQSKTVELRALRIN